MENVIPVVLEVLQLIFDHVQMLLQQIVILEVRLSHFYVMIAQVAIGGISLDFDVKFVLLLSSIAFYVQKMA